MEWFRNSVVRFVDRNDLDEEVAGVRVRECYRPVFLIMVPLIGVVAPSHS